MGKPLPLFEARARVLAAARPLATTETVPLGAARGRVLARPVRSEHAWPTTDRSAMDGFAVAAGANGLRGGTVLPVVGESLAGKPFDDPLAAGQAIRIMTGAVVPAGADAVVPVEQTSGFAGAAVTLNADVRAGQHVRPHGSELAAGSVALAAGTRVRAAEVGVLAVLGCTQVEVAARPVVAIVATGDEVVPCEQRPEPHQVRESNSWALAAQVEECGGEPLRLGIAPDEPEALRALLARGLQRADVLVTIGGISKGTHDLVHDALAQLGVRQEFHGIELKPGKPTFFGVATDGGGGGGGEARARRYVFGLPGNPASSFTVFDLLVRPLLAVLQGAAPGEPAARTPAAGSPWHTNTRLQALPAALRAGADGLVADLAKPSPSGDPFGVVHGDCYALVAPGARAADAPSVTLAGRSCGVQLP